MIPVKIHCGCGQHYAFDVEPVSGRMPYQIACPTCGADGTEAANTVIDQSLAAAETPPVPAPHIHLTAPTASHAPRPSGAPNRAQLGMISREQAEVEARAKVSWGDPPEAVLQFLMIQGFSREEAAEVMDALYKERANLVRAKGVKKIIFGSLSICAGVMGFIWMFFKLKVISTSILGILTGAILYGLWLLINGIIMVAVPKMQGGDVADQ